MRAGVVKCGMTWSYAKRVRRLARKGEEGACEGGCGGEARWGYVKGVVMARTEREGACDEGDGWGIMHIGKGRGRKEGGDKGKGKDLKEETAIT